MLKQCCYSCATNFPFKGQQRRGSLGTVGLSAYGRGGGTVWLALQLRSLHATVQSMLYGLTIWTRENMYTGSSVFKLRGIIGSFVLLWSMKCK